MFAVWMFGSAIENIWGPKRFLIFYLFTGIGAAVLHYVIFYFELQLDLSLINSYIADPSTYNFDKLLHNGYRGGSDINEMQTWIYYLKNMPLVGASGALFGLLIAFGWMFPNSQILLLIPPIPIRAKYFVAIYGLIELFSGVANVASDNIAHYAHIGGMLFGFILLKFWRVKHLN